MSALDHGGKGHPAADDLEGGDAEAGGRVGDLLGGELDRMVRGVVEEVGAAAFAGEGSQNAVLLIGAVVAVVLGAVGAAGTQNSFTMISAFSGAARAPRTTGSLWML